MVYIAVIEIILISSTQQTQIVLLLIDKVFVIKSPKYANFADNFSYYRAFAVHRTLSLDQQLGKKDFVLLINHVSNQLLKLYQ